MRDNRSNILQVSHIPEFVYDVSAYVHVVFEIPNFDRVVFPVRRVESAWLAAEATGSHFAFDNDDKS